MKTITSREEEEIRIPTTPDDWELYANEPGAEEAAKKLTKALEKAINAPSKSKAIAIMSTALREQQDFGARDSEPRALAESCLSRARGSNYRWTL